MSTFKHLLSKNKNLSSAIKNITGFYPGKIYYYELAFKHSSVANVDKNGFKESYERLEFLGDAIIGAIVAEYLYKRFPSKDEGYLTQVRSRLVGKEGLSIVSQKLGLEHLLNIKIANTRQQKSIREDVFEALVGAIYLDKGFSTARQFMVERVLKYYVDIKSVEENDNDYKSQIIRWAQKNKAIIDFKIEHEHYEGINKIYSIALYVNDEILGTGTSISKKKAEQLAAQQALEKTKLC